METKKLFFTLISSLLFSFSIAQSPAIEVLKKKLANSADDTSKVNTLNELSKSSSDNDTIAMIYAMQAKKLAIELDYLPGLALAYKHMGRYSYAHAWYIETLDYWNQSLHTFEAIGDNVFIANMLNNIGAVYKNQGSDEKALDYFIRSLQYSEKTGNKLRILTALMNVGSVFANKKTPEGNSKALEYYKKALPLTEELADKNALGTLLVNIGELYYYKHESDPARYKHESDSALANFTRSLKSFDSVPDISYSLNYIGKVWRLKGNFSKAKEFHQQAFDQAKKYNHALYMTQSLQGLGENYLEQKDYNAALSVFKQADPLAKEVKSNYELRVQYDGLAKTYAGLKEFQKAVTYKDSLITVKDSIFSNESLKREANLENRHQVVNLEKDKALQELDIERQKLKSNAFLGGLLLILVIAFIIYRGYRNKIKVNKILDSQKAEIESLILNILPTEVAQELQKTGAATPRYYEQATVLFTDFKNFSALADKMSPQDVVTELNDCFVAFDDIIVKYNLEKIKTIGDSYMCAGGIPTEDPDHVFNMAKASLEMQHFIKARNDRRKETGLPPWDIRIGINTGPLVAGVVGKKKYAYDIWGGTVNIASRMESNGEPGRINISSSTYELIRDKYKCVHRGKIFAKNIGEIDMYFIEHELNGKGKV